MLRSNAGALLALALAAAGGCRTEAGPPPDPGHPLALRAADGASALDRRIGGLQQRLRRAPGSAEAWVRLGEAWVAKARADADPGLYRSAEDAADAALALDPSDRPALALRGLGLLEAHRFEEARRLAGTVLAAAPQDLAALDLLSDALLELGRFEEAAAAAQRRVDLKPDLPAYARASWLRWLQGDADGALELAHRAADAGGDPEARAWVLAQAALVSWHRGDLARADADLDRALRDAPDHPAALAARGRVALSRGDPAAAVRWLERALARAPLPETAWLLGDARAALGDVAGARDAYARVVRDGRAMDRRTLAQFLAARGEDAQEAVALADAERAVRDDVYVEDARAWALYRAGGLDEADAAARRATRLGTPDARLLFHAGAIRAARGDLRGGLALIRRALRLNPTFDRAGAAEARALVARYATGARRQRRPAWDEPPPYGPEGRRRRSS